MCKNQDFGRESTRGFEPAQRTWGQFNRRVERLTPGRCIQSNAATGAIDLRRDLKDDSLTTAAANGSGAEENSSLVAQQAVVWVSPVGPFAELMHYAFFPLAAGFAQLKNDPIAVAVSASGSRAVQIALGVEHQSRCRRSAVRSAGEAVEHALGKLACRFGELEHGARAVCAAVASCAVEIALAIRNHTAVGKSGLGNPFEGVERFKIPLTAHRRKFEYGAALAGRIAADLGDAEHIARFVDKQRAQRAHSAVGAAGDV